MGFCCCFLGLFLFYFSFASFLYGYQHVIVARWTYLRFTNHHQQQQHHRRRRRRHLLRSGAACITWPHDMLTWQPWAQRVVLMSSASSRLNVHIFVLFCFCPEGYSEEHDVRYQPRQAVSCPSLLELPRDGVTAWAWSACFVLWFKTKFTYFHENMDNQNHCMSIKQAQET